MQLDGHRLARGGQRALRLILIFDDAEHLALESGEPVFFELARRRAERILAPLRALFVARDLLVEREARPARQRQHPLRRLAIRHDRAQMIPGALVAANRQGNQPLGLGLRHFGPRVGGADVLPDEEAIHHAPNRRAPPWPWHIDAVARHPMSHAATPAMLTMLAAIWPNQVAVMVTQVTV